MDDRRYQLRKSITNACLRKQFFRTKGEAKSAMYDLMVNKNILDLGLHIYECPVANHYHFGHERKHDVCRS